MSSVLLSLSVLSLARSAVGQAALCNGLHFPNWPACDEVLDATGWEDNYETTITNGCEPMCASYTFGNDRNCKLSLCFQSSQCLSQTANNLMTYYDIVKEWCLPQTSGGRYPFGDMYFEVRNNPAFVGEPPSSSNSMESRALKIEERGNVTVTTMSLADFEALREEEEEAARHALAVEQGREKAPAEKRQDDKFNLLLEYIAIARPGERQLVSQEISHGLTETWEFSEGINIGLAISVEVGASFFDLISTSISFEVSAGMEFSVTKGMSYSAGNCPRSARVYWEPLYNHAVGYLDSNPDEDIEIWAPRALNGEAEGRFVTECLG